MTIYLTSCCFLYILRIFISVLRSTILHNILKSINSPGSQDHPQIEVSNLQSVVHVNGQVSLCYGTSPQMRQCFLYIVENAYDPYRMDVTLDLLKMVWDLKSSCGTSCYTFRFFLLKPSKRFSGLYSCILSRFIPSQRHVRTYFSTHVSIDRYIHVFIWFMLYIISIESNRINFKI